MGLIARQAKYEITLKLFSILLIKYCKQVEQYKKYRKNAKINLNHSLPKKHSSIGKKYHLITMIVL